MINFFSSFFGRFFFTCDKSPSCVLSFCGKSPSFNSRVHFPPNAKPSRFKNHPNGIHTNTYMISMFEKLFAWCGLHRPGKEDGKDNATTLGGSDDLAIDDNSSEVGSEAGSSMISVEELDPVTGKPTRVLKKKKSLIGRAYRKVTKTRSGKNKKSGGKEEDGVAAAGGVAGGGA